jgi:hypothetical protein
MTDALTSSTEAALDRDPRQAPWGIYTGGSFVLDSSRVFMWFETPQQLASHLVAGLPEGYKLDDQDLADYRARVEPLAKRLIAEGQSAALLTEFNAAVKDVLVIDWWGRFDELTANQSEFACQIAGGFLGDDSEARALRKDELDDFVDFIRSLV